MDKGKLYGVSAGPGDPELLTLKAVRVLESVDVVVVADVIGGGHAALDIVQEHVQAKRVVSFSIPMSKDRSLAQDAYEDIAEKICGMLDEGKDVACITLGDATVYSTYFYIHKIVEGRGYAIEVIPGVTSFCASAACLGIPLCEGRERLTIVPASSDELEQALEQPGTKVFMKSGSSLTQLKEQLIDRGEIENASIVVRCGMPDERSYRSFSDAPEMKDYFSTVILKEER